MKFKLFDLAWCLFYAVLFAVVVHGQTYTETYTGTVLSYGSGFSRRATTSPFTLKLKGETSTDKAMGFLGVLQSKGQDALLEAVKNEDMGIFSVNMNLARTVNVVRKTEVNGMTRIYIVFERWTHFGEYRGGYRSLDYPFGYIELNMDPATGKGEGTYIAAARIRWKQDKEGSGSHVEVEDFATFPARLLDVRVKYPKP